ncbi:hypothetical protein GCM10007160_21480 [Litchfieldella qijiaojingensis]|uniref:Uncharacterized protein n=1 Tax=Litchfieldella qijiaojingensis TaxID=980347 RepID=A0ABQ2YS75_9GAMM|nr:hypothetical protein [Halomonas qijiaojingensis]GGX93583.1 hypothetical protein GCM10007160_21480 [Halomonas qijiaojingensis]
MVIITLQTIVMVFGAVVASTGLVLLFLRTEQAQNKIKLLGQEFEISTPALVVFLAGCIVFVVPLVIPIKDIESPVVILGQTPGGHTGQGALGDSPVAFPVLEEEEPNDQITEANLIEIGTRVQGSAISGQDRDYFKFMSSNQEPHRIRVILRKRAPGGYFARVTVYDSAERRMTRDLQSGDTPVSLAFDSTPDSLYYILVSPVYNPRPGSPYELEVREETVNY